MTQQKCCVLSLLCICCIVLSGCRAKESTGPGGAAASGDVPTFSLAWSEYPSWSVFGVANELGLLNGAAGELGTIEKKYGVDIQLKEAGYDSCLNMFTAGDCDAVCMTNMDALIVSPQRSGVAVLPTSTSNGADACLVTEAIADIEALKKYPVYGLANSVSQYCFARCLELAGFDEKDFTFTNMDPAIAATNLQQRSQDHQAIMVWNPFVLQTLRDRSDVRVLFDSTQIPGEIVDMVVIGTDSLNKPKAKEFIQAVAAAFYGVNEAMADAAQGDEVLVALGKKFSNLGLEDMRIVVKQTEFYQTPDAAKELLTGEMFRQKMQTVTDFCTKHGLAENPSIGYGPDAGEVKLRFDATYLDQ
jgi:NitT/TauT family transport system substrate-binding protein